MRISLAACLLLAAFGLARGQNPAAPSSREVTRRKSPTARPKEPATPTPQDSQEEICTSLRAVGLSPSPRIPFPQCSSTFPRPSSKPRRHIAEATWKRRSRSIPRSSRCAASPRCHNATSRKNFLILQTRIGRPANTPKPTHC